MDKTIDIVPQLEILLRHLVESTGKSKAEIIDEWKNALSGIAPLRERLKLASDPGELEVLVSDLVKQYDAESDYIMSISRAIRKFMVAQTKLEIAAARVDAIEWKRTLKSMKKTLKNAGTNAQQAIDNLDSGRNVYDILAESSTKIRQRQLRSFRSSWEMATKEDLRLRARLYFYRYRRHMFRLAFGVIFISLITIAFSAAFPPLYLGAVATLIGAAAQEYFIGPWLSRRLVRKLRSDLDSTLRLLEKAKFFSVIHLMMWRDIKDKEHLTQDGSTSAS